MTTPVRYSCLTARLTVSVDPVQLPLQDQQELLWLFLRTFDPGSGPDYEAYQAACEVVLRAVDRAVRAKFEGAK